MFALARGTIIVDCNGRVQNSTVTNTAINTSIITTSTIDMNGGVITSHGYPVNPTDVVNKDYADNLSTGGGIPTTTVTLTALVYTTAINIMTGSVMVLVKNSISGGPSATFMLSKSETYMQPSIFRMTSSSGNTSGEKLRLKWDPSTGIQLRKTGNNYDGQYFVKYISI
jgi:hypothetical protein